MIKKVRKELIDTITEFVFMESRPEKADVIFLPGGSNPAPAYLAAKLYCENYAPLILPSGKGPWGVGHFSGDSGEGSFDTECDFYCHILRKSNIPPEAILCEREAEYTKQNAEFSRRLLDKKGIIVRRALLACKSYHSRRAYTYYKMYFPDTEIFPMSVDVKDRGASDWFKTERGVDRICGEVSRMSEQFKDFLKEDINEN